MSIYSAVTLDVSRFPKPMALAVLDYEAIMAERLPRLAALFNDLGVAFDVEMLETDPAVIVQQADAYRELLLVARINDAVRAGMVAFAVGADLDHLAAFYGLTRRVIAPAAGATPAVMESDDELRRRTLLAPEAFATAGTHGGYVFHALTADVRVINADVWSPAPGQVRVAIQGREGAGAADAETVDAVRAHLYRDDIKPLTDVVSVSSVSLHEYVIDVSVYVRPGPDPAAVKKAALDSLSAMVAARRTPGRDVPVSAVIAAASVGPVDRVAVASPASDVAMGYGELAVCTGINVTVATHDG